MYFVVVIFFSLIVLLTPDDSFCVVPVLHSAGDMMFIIFGVPKTRCSVIPFFIITFRALETTRSAYLNVPAHLRAHRHEDKHCLPDNNNTTGWRTKCHTILSSH